MRQGGRGEDWHEMAAGALPSSGERLRFVVGGAVNQELTGTFDGERFVSDASRSFRPERVARWRELEEHEEQRETESADVAVASSTLDQHGAAESVSVAWMKEDGQGGRRILYTEEFDDSVALDLAIEEIRAAGIRMLGVEEAREKLLRRG